MNRVVSVAVTSSDGKMFTEVDVPTGMTEDQFLASLITAATERCYNFAHKLDIGTGHSPFDSRRPVVLTGRSYLAN